MQLLLLLALSVFATEYDIPAFCTNCCAHWTYDEQDNWGEIVCNTSATSGITLTNFCQTGKFQSPVNIASWTVDPTLQELNFVDYGPNAKMTIVNNGHTIQATYTNGYYNNDPQGHWYQIAQFHFHTHSEESVSGLDDVASMHLVHVENPAPGPTNQALSVLGILFTVGATDNPILAPIIQALPLIPTSGTSTTINFPGFQSQLLAMKAAKTDDYWNYPGSLTTPPCTEQIDWTLLATPWSISQAQLDALNAVLVSDTASTTPGTSNYRRVQRTLTATPYYPGGPSTCVCPTEKKVVWSSIHDGSICLARNECTSASHCQWGRHCSIPTGKQIGTCI